MNTKAFPYIELSSYEEIEILSEHSSTKMTKYSPKYLCGKFILYRRVDKGQVGQGIQSNYCVIGASSSISGFGLIQLYLQLMGNTCEEASSFLLLCVYWD